jgi:5'-nucleotidase
MAGKVAATFPTASQAPEPWPEGIRDYGRLRIVERTDPRGYDYYWFGLGPMVQTPGHSTDLEAIEDGYVAVTPLHLDLTHDPSVAMLRQRFEG